MGSEIAAIPASPNREQIVASLGGKRRGHRLFAAVDEAGAMLGVVTRRDMAQWALQPPEDEAHSLAAIARKAVTAFPTSRSASWSTAWPKRGARCCRW